MKTPSTEVGPGMWAFVAFFVLALALWLLMRSMFGRLRRINLAERDREQAERERAERAGLARDASGEGKEPSSQDASGVGDRPEEGERRGDEV
ncbi:hypothetical protein ACRTEC_15060 [Janibacter indicus]